jgi:hypothetical protein
MDAQHTKHVTYKLASHFVWCPKDRKKILVGSSSWGSTRGPIIARIQRRAQGMSKPSRHLTGSSKHSKNSFVGVDQRRITRDGKKPHPSLRSVDSMQQIITAKLKLITEPEQFTALRQTQLAYRDALNAVSRYAFSEAQNQPCDQTAQRYVYRIAHPLSSPFTAGL